MSKRIRDNTTSLVLYLVSGTSEIQLKSVNETVEMSDAKYKEVSKNLQKLEEEKIILMRYQMSCVSLKIQNDDQKTRLFTGLPSYAVFAVLVTHLTPLVTKEKESWIRIEFG